MKNKDAQFGDEPYEVSGMQLYAQTDETVQPDNTYWMSSNKTTVRTLNLDCAFKEREAQLDEITSTFLYGNVAVK